MMEQMEPAVLLALHCAIQRSPPDLFPDFDFLKPLLLERSPIAQNRPLFYAIAGTLIKYKTTGVFPEPIPYPQMKSDTTAATVSSFFDLHMSLLESIDITNSTHLQFLLRTVGKSGIHILCGLRRTAGSDTSLFPPSTPDLHRAFVECHKGQPLTVGGRAFSKHSIRDSARFWGYCQGPNDFINEEGLKCLNRVVLNGVWNNVFVLPHDAKAYEIRVPQGYGARWEFKQGGIAFRGFVEPMMEGGHEKRWRH
jgi:hypothetical protein